MLFLTGTMLATLLGHHGVRLTSRPQLYRGRRLPGTGNPFRLRFAAAPRA